MGFHKAGANLVEACAENVILGRAIASTLARRLCSTDIDTNCEVEQEPLIDDVPAG